MPIDVADAVNRALHRPVHGAFNLTTPDVIDLPVAARILRSTTVAVPRPVARGPTRLGWHLRLQPADVGWFDLMTQAPLLDADRARTERVWSLRLDVITVLTRMLAAVADGRGDATPALVGDSPSARLLELSSRQGGAEVRP